MPRAPKEDSRSVAASTSGDPAPLLTLSGKRRRPRHPNVAVRPARGGGRVAPRRLVRAIRGRARRSPPHQSDRGASGAPARGRSRRRRGRRHRLAAPTNQALVWLFVGVESPNGPFTAPVSVRGSFRCTALLHGSSTPRLRRALGPRCPRNGITAGKDYTITSSDEVMFASDVGGRTGSRPVACRTPLSLRCREN